MESKGNQCGLVTPPPTPPEEDVFDCSMARRRVMSLVANWSFRQADDESRGFLPVSKFPTNVHLDLLHHNLIPDPFVGKNENLVQWVGEKAWIYRTWFRAPTLAKTETAVLAFDGLDTYATVVLNGKEILKTQDMFIPERVDVTSLIKDDSKNELEITFDSAYLIGKKVVEQHPNHHWGCWNGDASRLAVRKAQYHYGWDWGPKLMTCGPWRPVSLEVYTSRISDLYYKTEVADSLKSAKVVSTAEIEGSGDDVVFDLYLDGNLIKSQQAAISSGVATSVFELTNPELWYPARYGKQPLYKLTATLKSKDQNEDVVTKKIGIRKAELVQRELDGQPGTSFFFQVNNIPVFCGGSDWIPADNFLPRISPKRYRDWVKFVVDGNQSMLRVWGGGIFEDQSFYDACDELGVLVWQDFLFGCGNYPAFPEFLDLIKREATANVKLLRAHPCIVIYAGNNEDYQYQESENLTYDPANHQSETWLKTNFPARYIYEKILVDVTRELVPDTYYHFGSPYGGKDTRDPTVGDIHQWNVWHGTQEKYQDFDKLTGRFVSEFGMEAFPDSRTIDAYLPKGREDPDRYPQSSTVDFHNKAEGHERRLALYLVENMRYKFDPLEQYVYCTQLMQAECIASAYRLWKRQWKGPRREYCAGVLVWQINDCWPVTSWAIADYFMRPKHAYYTVKRELAPITIGLKRTVSISADTHSSAYKIEMWVSNLTLDKRTCDVQVKAWNVVTGKQIYSQTLRTGLTLEPNRSIEVTDFVVPVETRDADEEMQTVVAAYLIEEGRQVARYVNWPDPLKYTHLQKPRYLEAKLSEDATIVQISAEVPVKGVALYVNDDSVVFADNCVDIVPGETVSIAVEGLKQADDQLTVRYLN